MGKKAITVTLEADNLTWLRGRARAATPSVSETLDRLIASVRKSGGAGEKRSVVGTISIAPGDPALVSADLRYGRSSPAVCGAGLGLPLLTRDGDIQDRGAVPTVW